MRKLLTFLIVFTFSVFLSSTSLSYANSNELTQKQIDKIDKIIKDLGAQGNLTYPLKPEVEQRLKQQLSKDEFEFLLIGLRLHVPIYPIEIRGKILDENNNLFTDEAILTISVYHKHTEKITDGHFRYDSLPEGRGVGIEVSKEGYHGDKTGVGISFEENGKIIAKDIILHLIKKGTPVDLEWTTDAEIKFDPDQEEYAGWSFSKRWGYPASSNEYLDMILKVNDDGQLELSMKEGGGFIKAKRYIDFENRLHQKPVIETAEDMRQWREREDKYIDKPHTKFKWMPMAPELGYKQTITPSQKYYYFRTPQGKYGKLKFRGYNINEKRAYAGFTYYLNPQGTRSLEVKERIIKSPVNPKYRKWREKHRR